jgi:hypothetical protein
MFTPLITLANLFVVIGDVPAQLNNLLNTINTGVTAVGATVFLISVAVAGIMRMVAFGSERRIALSNMALTAAVVGLVIMLLAGALHTFITTGIGK